MFFGLTSGIVSFQRAFDVVLTEYKWKTFFESSNDNIIYSNTVKDHIDHANNILTSPRDAGITQ